MVVPFWSLQLRGAAIRAKFGMTRWNKLQRPRKERNSMMFEGDCKLQIPSIELELTS